MEHAINGRLTMTLIADMVPHVSNHWVDVSDGRRGLSGSDD